MLYICFDPVPSPKGASTHISYFVQALTEQYDVTLLSPGQQDAPTDARYAGARHRVIPLTQANYLDRALAFREAIWDELERTRYDIVHFRTMWAAMPVAAEKAYGSYTVVAEVNAVESIELKYHYPDLRGNPSLLAKLRQQEHEALQAADLLLTPSQVTKQYITRQHIPEDCVRVIPNGVDLSLFSPPETRSVHDPLTALYVGTLTPWQGVDILLKALQLVNDTQPLRLQLLCPDSGKWLKPVAKLIRKLGLTTLVDVLPPVPHAQVGEVIRAADLCVAPLAPTERNTVQGCNPIKLYEYMACGKPIVASDLPVVREVLTHDENALLFKVLKPARLADCLLRLADDAPLRQRLGLAAWHTVRDRFTWRHAQDALLQAYAEVCPSTPAYRSSSREISLSGV